MQNKISKSNEKKIQEQKTVVFTLIRFNQPDKNGVCFTENTQITFPESLPVLGHDRHRLFDLQGEVQKQTDSWVAQLHLPDDYDKTLYKKEYEKFIKFVSALKYGMDYVIEPGMVSFDNGKTWAVQSFSLVPVPAKSASLVDRMFDDDINNNIKTKG